MAFFAYFKRKPTFILALSVITPGIFLSIFNSVEDFERYIDYLNEYRIVLLGLDTKDKDYRKVYYTLHHKYPTMGIVRCMLGLDEVEEMEYCKSDIHKFNSVDPAIAATFHQRYDNNIVRKHNKRRHK